MMDFKIIQVYQFFERYEPKMIELVLVSAALIIHWIEHLTCKQGAPPLR